MKFPKNLLIFCVYQPHLINEFPLTVLNFQSKILSNNANISAFATNAKLKNINQYNKIE